MRRPYLPTLGVYYTKWKVKSQVENQELSATPLPCIVAPIVPTLATDMLDMALHLALLLHLHEFLLPYRVVCLRIAFVEVGLCILVGVVGELAKDTADLCIGDVFHVHIIPCPGAWFKNYI